MPALAGARGGEDARREHRGEREGHHQRDHDREGGGEAEGVPELPHEAAHEGHGQEDHHQRDGGRGDGEGDLPRARDGGLEGRAPLLFRVPEDVLQHDDGIVDDDAGGERQPEHGQVVEGEARHAHGGEGGDDRHRDRQRRHEGGPELLHGKEEDHGGEDGRPRHLEEELGVALEEGRRHRRHDGEEDRALVPAQPADEGGDDEAGEQPAEQQVVLHLVERALDEAREVADDLELDVLGQALLDLGQPRLHAVHHRHRVGAGLLADEEGHRVGAVEARERARLLLGVRHRGDVAHAHRAALEVGHDEVVERLHRLDAAQGAQAFLVAARGEPPAGDLDVLPQQRVLHLLDGQVEGGELVRVRRGSGSRACGRPPA